MPQRVYEVQTTRLLRDKDGNPINKGYRIVPSLDPNISAVERALKDHGFQYYMPCEFQAVRNRRKTDTWTKRRKPILGGYIFVADVTDFGLLESLPGVIGTVGSATGEKYQLSTLDFIFLRTKEANSLLEAEIEIERNNKLAERKKRHVHIKKLERVKKRFKPGSRVDVQWGKAIGRKATIVGVDDEARLQALVDGLEAMGTITMMTEDVRIIEAA